MGKVMLVLDKPVSCHECPLLYRNDLIYVGDNMYKQTYHCRMDGECTELENTYDEIPKWCPLKELNE